MHKFKQHSKLSRFIAVMTAAFVMLVMSASMAFAADITSFNSSSYKVKITVNNDNSFKYHEMIVIDASAFEETPEDISFQHKISESYIGRVSDVSVKGYAFEFDEATNLIDITVDELGTNTKLAFEISYKLTGVDYMGEKDDVLILPMISGNHEGVIDDVQITVQYPENFKFKEIQYITGDEVSRTNAYGKWVKDKNNHRITYTGSDIPANTQIALNATLPSAYWANATSIGITKNLSIFVLLAGLIILILLKILFGKDPEIKIEEEHYAPDELSPAHVGYLVDKVIDNTDITSIFFYMAQKGYMRITEVERKKFSFTYLRNPKNEMKAIRLLFEAIFDKCSVGDTVMLSDRVAAIQGSLRKIKRSVPSDIFGGYKFFSAISHFANTVLWLTFAAVCFAVPFLNIVYITQSGGQTAKGFVMSLMVAGGMCILMENLNVSYYKMRRRLVKEGKQVLTFAILAYLAAVAAFIYFFRFSYNGRIGDQSVILFEVVFFVIAPLMVTGMKSRSKKNIYFTGKIKGLEQFMTTASKAQIADICKEDPDYYFKLMPYAFSFNISRHFAGIFEYVQVKGPDWYVPYGIKGEYDFDIVIMNSMIVNLQSELAKLVYDPLESVESIVKR